MKVAIIGAGVSGLACAHELERLGVNPTVYERKSFIGDMETHVTATVEVVYRPYKDWITYIKKNFNIDISPLNTINTLTHHSSNKTTIIKGNLGYLTKRGREKDSLIVQLYSQLRNTEVIFDEQADYKKLSRAYDYIVIANGDSNYTKELGCWQEWTSGWIKGAAVLGNFNPTEVIMWLDKSYSNKGYAYLTPFNGKKASLNLFVPYVSKVELDRYWELFFNTENIKYTIVEEFLVEHHSGFVYPHKVENIYFVGSADGAVDPFMGFGQVSCILQGVYAAQSIAKGKNYNILVKNIVKRHTDWWEFRKYYDNASNKDYDKVLTIMGLPGVKQTIYKSPINIIGIGGIILRFKRKQKNN